MRAAVASTILCVGVVACNDGPAPERRCVAHTDCDDGFLCGPEGTCQPSSACAGDDDCCPGALCFSGWCRPTPGCSVGGACPGLGDVCEARPGLTIAGLPADGGVCVAAPCDALGGCADPFTCVAGRCLLGPPCDGRCGADEVCEPATDRCLPMPPAPCTCVAGWVVASGLGGSALACGAGTYGCACALEPSLPPGRPGVDQRIVATAPPTLVSYEPEYGDLVWSRFEGARRDVALDGVPIAGGSPVIAADAYRGGIAEPGPDRGARPAVARLFEGGFEVLYRDLDRQREMFARVDPVGARVAIGELPIDGLDVGRYACLARRADGRAAGLVFVARDAADQRAVLYRVEALVPAPASGADWAVAEVLASDLPVRSDAPCADACGLGEACVVDHGAERCAGLLGATCAACGPHEVCATLDGGDACRPEVERRYAADRLPFGEGLFASCDVVGPDVYAAWYDADLRRVVAARWPFGPGDRVVVDDGPGKDPGRFASLAVDPSGRLGLAYQDAAQGTLVFAEAARWGAPWSRTLVPTSPGAEPGVGARALWVAGEPAIVHLDGRATSVELAARRGGCWGHAVVLGAGHAYPDAALGADAIVIAAQALGFDDRLRPLHAPVVVERTLPPCD